MKGFRLKRKVEAPPILIGALRPGMLELASRVGDGVILNWILPNEPPRILPHVRKHGDTGDCAHLRRARRRPRARARGGPRLDRRLLSVPYRAQQEWLGRGRCSRRCGSCGARGTAPAPWPCPRRSSTLYPSGPAEEVREHHRPLLRGRRRHGDHRLARGGRGRPRRPRDRAPLTRARPPRPLIRDAGGHPCAYGRCCCSRCCSLPACRGPAPSSSTLPISGSTVHALGRRPAGGPAGRLDHGGDAHAGRTRHGHLDPDGRCGRGRWAHPQRRLRKGAVWRHPERNVRNRPAGPGQPPRSDRTALRSC